MLRRAGTRPRSSHRSLPLSLELKDASPCASCSSEAPSSSSVRLTFLSVPGTLRPKRRRRIRGPSQHGDMDWLSHALCSPDGALTLTWTSVRVRPAGPT